MLALSPKVLGFLLDAPETCSHWSLPGHNMYFLILVFLLMPCLGCFPQNVYSMNTYSHYLKTTLGVNSFREPTLILKVYVPTIIFYAGFCYLSTYYTKVIHVLSFSLTRQCLVASAVLCLQPCTFLNKYMKRSFITYQNMLYKALIIAICLYVPAHYLCVITYSINNVHVLSQ